MYIMFLDNHVVTFSNDVSFESCLLRREDNDVLVIQFTAYSAMYLTEIIELLKLLFGCFLNQARAAEDRACLVS